MRLMIVDDSRTIRLLLRDVLGKIGYGDVIDAESGESAISKLQNAGVAGVLLDLHMPGMDGLATLRAIRQDPALTATPVVMISSDNDMRNVEEARRLGANGFIRKPFTADGVAKTLGTILGAVR